VELVENQNLQNKMGTRDELPAGIIDAADHIKKRENQLRQTKCGICTRVAKRTEVQGGIFEYNCKL
jgi:hypothetical protein